MVRFEGLRGVGMKDVDRASEHTSMTAREPDVRNCIFSDGDAPINISNADMRALNRV